MKRKKGRTVVSCRLFFFYFPQVHKDFAMEWLGLSPTFQSWQVAKNPSASLSFLSSLDVGRWSPPPPAAVILENDTHVAPQGRLALETGQRWMVDDSDKELLWTTLKAVLAVCVHTHALTQS